MFVESRVHLSMSRDAEEDNDASDIIDGCVLLLPAFDRLLNDCLSSLLC